MILQASGDDDVPSSILRQAGIDTNFSDEIEALHAQQIDTAIGHKRNGTVIQHRHWSLAEAFRSDEDRSCGARHSTESCCVI